MNEHAANTITRLINGPNGLIILLLVLILGIVVIMCIRGGLLRIKTSNIELGTQYEELERTIIRNQIQYINEATRAFEWQIPKDETYDYDRGRLILQMLANKMIEWVIFNHIEESAVYIENRQEQIWNLILASVEKEELRSPEFRAATDAYVKKIIHRLVSIRKEYGRHVF